MSTVFFRRLQQTDKPLAETVHAVRSGRHCNDVNEVDTAPVEQISGSPFTYLVSELARGAAVRAA